MQKEVFTFLSSDKKTNIHAVKWLPDTGEYKAILQITHGMIEFIERYEDFAGYMTKQGFLVVGHDHLGHGESVTTKEDWGYFAEKHPSNHLVKDMHHLRKIIQKEHPSLPYFMLGHSMGSYLLRKYITIYGAGISGAIIMGTGMVPTPICNAGITLCHILAKSNGWHYRSKFIENLLFGNGYHRYDVTGKDLAHSWLTKDEKIVDFYYHEPACTFKFTLNGYLGLVETVKYDNNLNYMRKIPKELPIFIVSGEDDPVGEFTKGVIRVYQKMVKAGLTDITVKLYKGDRHEILNETDKETVYQDIFDWIEQLDSMKS